MLLVPFLNTTRCCGVSNTLYRRSFFRHSFVHIVRFMSMKHQNRYPKMHCNNSNIETEQKKSAHKRSTTPKNYIKIDEFVEMCWVRLCACQSVVVCVWSVEVATTAATKKYMKFVVFRVTYTQRERNTCSTYHTQWRTDHQTDSHMYERLSA